MTSPHQDAANSIEQLGIQANIVDACGHLTAALYMRYAAELIEQQAKALSEAEAERDRIARNRDMWRTQCERQADQITKLRGEVSALESEHANG